MHLAEILELEARLSADREREDDELWRRERAIVAAQPEKWREDTPRNEQTRAWLRALPEDERTDTSGWIAGLRWSRRALLLAGVIVGGGLAAGLLRYDGTHPINVLPWIAILVILPLLTSVVSAIALIALQRSGTSRRGDISLFIPIARVFLWLSERFTDPSTRQRMRGIRARLASTEGFPRSGRESKQRKPSPADEDASRWRSAVESYRTRRGAYPGLEARIAFSAAQLFSIALSVSALVVLVTRVVSSDLAFGWSTTLSLQPERLRALTDILSVPFAWLVGHAPSEELIEATRYVRLERGYTATGASSTGSGPWWSFLFWSALCWGLLPRVALLLVNEGLRRRYQRALPPLTPDVEALLHRLRTPLVEFEAEREDPGDDAPLPLSPAREIELPQDARRALVFRWRDAAFDDATIDAILARRHGLRSGTLHDAGGLSFESEDTGLASLRELDPLDPVAIFVESWETPDRAMARLIERIRRAGTNRPILVFGSAGDAADNSLWRDYLGQLHDPYLSFKPFEEANDEQRGEQ